MQPDRWRAGGNRRSFVAIAHKDIVGHCRGVDNAAHPDSRVYFYETTDGHERAAVEDALIAAQVGVSHVPLTIKIDASDRQVLDLAVRAGALPIQVMPPWRRRVGPDLRAWATRHRGATEPIGAADGEAILALDVDHYRAQHAAWSPAADRDTMLDYFADDHAPDSARTWNRKRSCCVRRDGTIVAAALIWGDPASLGDDAPETVVISRPYDSDTAWRGKLACLAAVVRDAEDGDEILIDSHVSMQREFTEIRSIPGLVTECNDWTVIVAILVPHGPVPHRLSTPLPADAPQAFERLGLVRAAQPRRGAPSCR